MMGFGFWEMAVVCLVALLVVGPERLPGAARTLGAYLRKARSTWSGLRNEIERELAAEDVRRTFKDVSGGQIKAQDKGDEISAAPAADEHDRSKP